MIKPGANPSFFQTDGGGVGKTRPRGVTGRDPACLGFIYDALARRLYMYLMPSTQISDAFFFLGHAFKADVSGARNGEHGSPLFYDKLIIFLGVYDPAIVLS